MVNLPPAEVAAARFPLISPLPLMTCFHNSLIASQLRR